MTDWKERAERAEAELARLQAQEPVAWKPEWAAFVEYWTHESHLQTFADRERFREAAKAMLAAPPAQPAEPTIDEQVASVRGGCGMSTNTKDRATTEPGGCECEHCGCIFIGGPSHNICGDCLAAVEAALREDAQRAEWHAEMRRDAFGGSV